MSGENYWGGSSDWNDGHGPFYRGPGGDGVPSYYQLGVQDKHSQDVESTKKNRFLFTFMTPRTFIEDHELWLTPSEVKVDGTDLRERVWEAFTQDPKTPEYRNIEGNYTVTFSDKQMIVIRTDVPPEMTVEHQEAIESDLKQIASELQVDREELQGYKTDAHCPGGGGHWEFSGTGKGKSVAKDTSSESRSSKSEKRRYYSPNDSSSSGGRSWKGHREKRSRTTQPEVIQQIRRDLESQGLCVKGVNVEDQAAGLALYAPPSNLAENQNAAAADFVNETGTASSSGKQQHFEFE